MLQHPVYSPGAFDLLARIFEERKPIAGAFKLRNKNITEIKMSFRQAVRSDSVISMEDESIEMYIFKLFSLTYNDLILTSPYL